MNYAVVIPAHNEAQFLPGLLQSVYAQTVLPVEVVLVNDNSTDKTEEIMQKAEETHPNTHYINRVSSNEHLPGAKVVEAFNAGLDKITASYHVVVKLDADLILPTHYFEEVLNVFEGEQVGIVGGVCYEKNKAGEWELNHPMQMDHVRGAFKAYHVSCLNTIGGLRSAMGWDTVDEHLARYYGYRVITLPSLKVKHLRPVGAQYKKAAGLRQGEAFYRLRYGVFWSVLAAIKSGWSKKSIRWTIVVLLGYTQALIKRTPRLVNASQGLFIRNYRRLRLGKDKDSPLNL